MEYIKYLIIRIGLLFVLMGAFFLFMVVPATIAATPVAWIIKLFI